MTRDGHWRGPGGEPPDSCTSAPHPAPASPAPRCYGTTGRENAFYTGKAASGHPAARGRGKTLSFASRGSQKDQSIFSSLSEAHECAPPAKRPNLPPKSQFAGMTRTNARAAKERLRERKKGNLSHARFAVVRKNSRSSARFPRRTNVRPQRSGTPFFP